MFKYRKENIEAIMYTKEHRKAFKKTEKELLGKNTWRSIIHDFDKIVLYNFFSHSKVKEIHRKYARHHDNEIKKRESDYIEMIIDWECARFTKPDKPLNAFDTLYKFYPHLEKEILPLLKKYNLDYHTVKE